MCTTKITQFSYQPDPDPDNQLIISGTPQAITRLLRFVHELPLTISMKRRRVGDQKK